MRLIDADALKKKIDEVQYTQEFCIEHQIDYSISMQMLGMVIDNAPTVEYTFEEAFQKTVCEQRLYCPKRPQGEWEESHIFSCGNILRMGMNVIEHKCKNCGRWSIKWVSTIPDNFCSNCGADMRGKEE